MYEMGVDTAEESVDMQKDRYLTFVLGGESYGIEIRHVTEIIGMQPITPIPELPRHMKGIINLRGAIIPLMDVRLRFKMEPREYDARTCIIVTSIHNTGIGLIVDSVSEVMTIPDDAASDAPSMYAHTGGSYINRIGTTGSGIKLLLDCDKLIGSDESESIEDIINGGENHGMV